MTTATLSMDHADWVRTLYGHLLHRRPTHGELIHWTGQLENGFDARAVLLRIVDSQEYANAHRVRLAYRPGHYYSPVVDPDEAEKSIRQERNVEPGDLKGLRYPVEPMAAFWSANRDTLAATPFTPQKTDARRYYTQNPVFPVGDAATLRAMILSTRPGKIIEVGSGFSTACMLDTLDEGGREDVSLTCIEPYPERLYANLRPVDRDRLKIIERRVQEVDVALFSELGPGDILFIDSTHVMKTGSDVNHELFEILPALRKGVLIHFHDIHYPFEYPRGWVLEKNLSWNEIYAVRAFLMYNDAFEIVFHGSFFAARFPDLVRTTYAPFLKNPGGSLWIKKIR